MNKLAVGLKYAWWNIFEVTRMWENIAKQKAGTTRADRRKMFAIKKEWDNMREHFSDAEDFVKHMSWIPLVAAAPACLLREMICFAMLMDQADENQEEDAECRTSEQPIEKEDKQDKSVTYYAHGKPDEQEEVNGEDGSDPE